MIHVDPRTYDRISMTAQGVDDNGKKHQIKMTWAFTPELTAYSQTQKQWLLKNEWAWESQMFIFYVGLIGYDPESDETDNLLKWVQASSIEQVQEFIKKHNIQVRMTGETGHKVADIYLSGHPAQDNQMDAFDYGVDVILTDYGEKWAIGQTARSWNREAELAYFETLKEGDEVIETGESGMKGKRGTVYQSDNGLCIMWEGDLGTSVTHGTRRVSDI